MKSLASFGLVIQEIKKIIHQARQKSFQAINQEMLKAYFEIGRKIVEEEQRGKERADYGQKLLKVISEELLLEFGRGFDVSNLQRMRKCYLTYQKWETLSPKLTWSHYSELIKINEPLKRRYFEKYAAQEQLSVRDLKRQIYSLHYERLALSKNKKALLSHEKFLPVKAEEVIKDPYILEFLNLEEKAEYNEQELESQILENLQKFLLELGQGFSFVARQKRISLDNDNFYIDLLLYNIYLKCYVVLDLKVGKFKHEDVGQMNFYLNYVKKEMNKEGDKAPVGIILCTEKNTVQVEFALAGLSNKLFVSKYQVYLPSKEKLEKEIRKII